MGVYIQRFDDNVGGCIIDGHVDLVILAEKYSPNWPNRKGALGACHIFPITKQN